MGVVAFEILGSLLLAAALAVEEVGSNVVQIDEFAARFLADVAVPASVCVVAALNLAAGPLVARSQRDDDGRCTFLPHVVDELSEVPSEAVHHLVIAGMDICYLHTLINDVAVIGLTLRCLHLVDVAGVGRRSDTTAVFGPFYLADVVVSELYEHEVARTQTVVDAVPTSFAQVTTATASSLSGVDDLYLALIENRICHGSPTPHAVFLLVFILHRGVAADEYHGTTAGAVYIEN